MLRQESPPSHEGAEHINAFTSPAAVALPDLLNKNAKSNAQASSVCPLYLLMFFCFLSVPDREISTFKANFPGPLPCWTSRGRTSVSPWHVQDLPGFRVMVWQVVISATTELRQKSRTFWKWLTCFELWIRAPSWLMTALSVVWEWPSFHIQCFYPAPEKGNVNSSLGAQEALESSFPSTVTYLPYSKPLHSTTSSIITQIVFTLTPFLVVFNIQTCCDCFYYNFKDPTKN